MDVNITIIGAGVVGLAIARELSKFYSKVYVIEKHNTFGQETSSRSSEVIHSGIYYPSNFLKTKLCIEGKSLLYEYCEEKKISHRKIGKLIVATNVEEEVALVKLFQHGKLNGIKDIELLNKEEINEIEPDVYATKAIYSPYTGIIDSWELMKQLETDAIANGVTFVYNHEVINIIKDQKGYIVTVKQNEDSFSFTTNIIINSGGLCSHKIAKMVGAYKPSYDLHYWKGEYFSVCNGKHKYIKHLIYPVPVSNNVSLGIHVTLNLQGRMRLGPNAIYLPDNSIDYTVDVTHCGDFYISAKRFLPFLELEDLQPEQAGIRPKLQKPGDPVRDFIIQNETNYGFPGFINLIGIESPGLTSCLAIAKYVISIL